MANFHLLIRRVARSILLLQGWVQTIPTQPHKSHSRRPNIQNNLRIYGRKQRGTDWSTSQSTILPVPRMIVLLLENVVRGKTLPAVKGFLRLAGLKMMSINNTRECLRLVRGSNSWVEGGGVQPKSKPEYVFFHHNLAESFLLANLTLDNHLRWLQLFTCNQENSGKEIENQSSANTKLGKKQNWATKHEQPTEL